MRNSLISASSSSVSCSCEFDANLSVEDAVDVLRPEMNFFQLRDRSVAPGEVCREVFAAKFFLFYELANLLLVLREKISVIIVRMLVVTSILVTRMNSRDKRAVVVFSDILLASVNYQLAEVRDREDLAVSSRRPECRSYRPTAGSRRTRRCS